MGSYRRGPRGSSVAEPLCNLDFLFMIFSINKIINSFCPSDSSSDSSSSASDSSGRENENPLRLKSLCADWWSEISEIATWTWVTLPRGLLWLGASNDANTKLRARDGGGCQNQQKAAILLDTERVR